MSFDIAVTKQTGSFDCDFAFSTGPGLTAVLGPSGAGKTSLLYMIAGVTRPDEGRIAIAGRVLFDSAARIDLPVEQRGGGYIFQDGRLFPHLSVRANLLYGAKLARDRAPIMGLDETVAFLGIATLLDRKPATLSGGEAQRVAIGRALLSAPAFLLMDEPLSGLDRARRDEILTVIERLRDELLVPILYVSHDHDEVERLADHLVLIEVGKVIAAGAANDVLTDLRHPIGRAADAVSLLHAQPMGHDQRFDITTAQIGSLLVQIPGDWTGRPALRLRVRASDISLSLGEGAPSSILNSLPARIVEAEAFGSAHMRVALLLDGGGDDARLLASITRKSWEQLGLAIGAGVTAHIKAMAFAASR